MAKKAKAERPDAAADEPVGDDESPAVGLDLGILERILPEETKAIFDLFDGEFHTFEIWDALEAVAKLGRKAEALLAKDRPRFGSTDSDEVRAVIPASTITGEELCGQLKAALAEAKPVIADGDDENSGAVQMNPILAGLLVALARKVAEKLLERLLNR